MKKERKVREREREGGGKWRGAESWDGSSPTAGVEGTRGTARALSPPLPAPAADLLSLPHQILKLVQFTTSQSRETKSGSARRQLETRAPAGTVPNGSSPCPHAPVPATRRGVRSRTPSVAPQVPKRDAERRDASPAASSPSLTLPSPPAPAQHGVAAVRPAVCPAPSPSGARHRASRSGGAEWLAGTCPRLSARRLHRHLSFTGAGEARAPSWFRFAAVAGCGGRLSSSPLFLASPSRLPAHQHHAQRLQTGDTPISGAPAGIWGFPKAARLAFRF